MDLSKTYFSDQQNKKHKKTRDKVTKRRKMQKELQQAKKEKRAERKDRKVKYHKQFMEKIEGIDYHKLKKQVLLFKEKFPKDLDDLIAICKFIDSGKKIDINEIENNNSKILIENIFELFGLENKGGVFSKGRKTINFEEAILLAMNKKSKEEEGEEDDVVDEKKEQEQLSNSSESEEDIKDNYEDVPRVKKINKPETKPKVKRNTITRMDNTIGMFGTISNYQNYDKDKKKEKQDRFDQVDQEEKDKRVELYIDNYNKINRPKTLMEIHKEKMAEKGKKLSLGSNKKKEAIFDIVNNQRFNLKNSFTQKGFRNAF